jgi:hypothetical protein
MRTGTRVVLGASIVLAPLTLGIADQLRMSVMPPDGEYGEAMVVAMMEHVAANAPTWTAVSYLNYGGLFLSIGALLAIWRLSLDRAPRWAWAGVLLAGLGVIGQAVHLMGHFALLGASAAHEDPVVAAELYLLVEGHGFAMALFVPFLIGLLAIIPQAVGLRRARVIPRWAALAVGAGVASMIVAGGSTPLATALYTGLVVVGLAPAAIAMVRSGPSGRLPVTEPVPAAPHDQEPEPVA